LENVNIGEIQKPSQIEQGFSACLEESPSWLLPRSYENASIGDVNLTEKSLTGLKIMDRVSTSLDGERKVWMGQNKVDTRRRSYTAITHDSTSKINDEKAQNSLRRKTSAPTTKTVRVSDIFEEGPLEKQGFDSPFLEDNQHGW
jgi:hypothetical protein